MICVSEADLLAGCQHGGVDRCATCRGPKKKAQRFDSIVFARYEDVLLDMGVSRYWLIYCAASLITWKVVNLRILIAVNGKAD